MTTPTTEQAIQTAFAAIFNAVTGIRKAFETVPMTISTEDCPAVIFLPGAAVPTGKQAPKWMEVNRQYAVRIYVTPVQAGESGDAETAVIPWIAAGMKALLAHPALGNVTKASQVAYVMPMQYMGDSGLVVLPTFAGQAYLGIEFKVQITYHIPYVFAPNE